MGGCGRIDNVTAYYNELDAYPAQWLRNLAAGGEIPAGDVDERDIRSITDYEKLRGYQQGHFFAGIGVWAYALKEAGFPTDVRVWTGSCPCQPFSAAGKKLGTDDARHLWPDWFKLIRECRPECVFGEQVASDDGLAWLDIVYDALEGAGYTVWAVDMCAAGYGAPHIRQRLYFVAVANGGRFGAGLGREERRWATIEPQRQGAIRELGNAASERRGETWHEHRGRSAQRDSEPSQADFLADTAIRGTQPSEQPGRLRGAESIMQKDGMADTERDTGKPRRLANQSREGNGTPRNGAHAESGRRGDAGTVVYTNGRRRGQAGCDVAGDATENGRWEAGRNSRTGPVNGFWSDAIWLPCTDGLARCTKPQLEPLVARAPGDVAKIRAYGNALCAPQAIGFVKAAMELLWPD